MGADSCRGFGSLVSKHDNSVAGSRQAKPAERAGETYLGKSLRYNVVGKPAPPSRRCTSTRLVTVSRRSADPGQPASPDVHVHPSLHLIDPNEGVRGERGTGGAGRPR